MTRKIPTYFVCIFFLLQACKAGEPTNMPVDGISLPLITETPATAIVDPNTVQSEFSPVSLKAGYGFRSAWADLYFTDPFSPYAADEAGGVDGILSASIISASESVDVALSSLSLPIITNALIRATDRGVKVRIVMESDYLDSDRPNPRALIEAGIPIIGDGETGLMANNFIVIDNKEVWTGSMTFTDTGVYHGFNNLIAIESEELAQNYTKEFDEMYINDQFGPNVVPETPNPVVTVQGTQIESLFLPDDLFAARLTELLNDAQESIVFAAFSFTSEGFGDLIRKKANDGIKVTGVIDDFEIDPTQVSQYELFNQNSLDIKLGNPETILLSNFIIIDNEIAILGTYDFSNKAELTTDGNVLIIHNKTIAESLLSEFQKIQSVAQK